MIGYINDLEDMHHRIVLRSTDRYPIMLQVDLEAIYSAYANNLPLNNTTYNATYINWARYYSLGNEFDDYFCLAAGHEYQYFINSGTIYWFHNGTLLAT